MANYQCDSCEELRQNAPNFIINGLGDEEEQSLYDNKGLSGNSENCPDVNDMNDCLIGMMDKEVNQYETCDWKVFMKRFIQNVWTLLKAIITWLCGLQGKMDRMDCEVKYLFNGDEFKIGETPTSGGSYIRPGDGVSFLIRSSSQVHTSDVTLRYIAGGLCSVVGSLAFFTQSFRDGDGTRRSGNPTWGTTGAINGSGDLIVELRINKKEYPMIKQLFRGFGQETAAGSYHFEVLIFEEGDRAYGYHHGETGESDGWVVPENFTFVQLRMTSIMAPFSFSNHDDGSGAPSAYLSPYGLLGVRMNRSGIECE